MCLPLLVFNKGTPRKYNFHEYMGRSKEESMDTTVPGTSCHGDWLIFRCMCHISSQLNRTLESADPSDVEVLWAN